jgi:hypothetical protein
VVQNSARCYYCLESERTVSGSVLNSQQILKKSSVGLQDCETGSTTRQPRKPEGPFGKPRRLSATHCVKPRYELRWPLLSTHTRTRRRVPARNASAPTSSGDPRIFYRHWIRARGMRFFLYSHTQRSAVFTPSDSPGHPAGVENAVGVNQLARSTSTRTVVVRPTAPATMAASAKLRYKRLHRNSLTLKEKRSMQCTDRFVERVGC